MPDNRRTERKTPFHGVAPAAAKALAAGAGTVSTGAGGDAISPMPGCPDSNLNSPEGGHP